MTRRPDPAQPLPGAGQQRQLAQVQPSQFLANALQIHLFLFATPAEELAVAILRQHTVNDGAAHQDGELRQHLDDTR